MERQDDWRDAEVLHDDHPRAERFVAEVHDRMPVVLEAEDFAAWLNEGGYAVLRPAGNEVLQRWPVPRRINSSRVPVGDPTLIEKDGPAT
jgi:putative SOS response-associated peptidase YedK